MSEFLGPISNNPDMIFGTVFGQSGTDFRIVCMLVFFFFLCVIVKI